MRRRVLARPFRVVEQFRGLAITVQRVLGGGVIQLLFFDDNVGAFKVAQRGAAEASLLLERSVGGRAGTTAESNNGSSETV